jgi:hypothetical protein
MIKVCQIRTLEDAIDKDNFDSFKSYFHKMKKNPVHLPQYQICLASRTCKFRAFFQSSRQLPNFL